MAVFVSPTHILVPASLPIVWYKPWAVCGDCACLQHLVPMLERPETWDVLIAHYLGVDHAGHTYGVNSNQMSAKLQQMDDQVSLVIGEVTGVLGLLANEITRA